MPATSSQSPVVAKGLPGALALPADDVIAALSTTRAGLSSDEAARRLESVGPNRIASRPPRSLLAVFLAQFTDVLIYVLLIAAILAGALGHFTDAAVILGAVVINGTIGFIQETRAEHALSAIGRLLAENATLVRDGVRRSVPVAAIVPGDLVLLEAGDKVPADLRLIACHGLQIQEAALTGESVAVDKDPAPVAGDAPLGDRTAMAFAGTIVTRGNGRGVVVATGDAAELGRINAMLGTVRSPQTPFTLQLAHFGRTVTVLILSFSALTFAWGYFLRGMPATELFFAVVGIAVAAVPEGLPAIVTIALAVGMERMARRKAIVRYLAAVETLGSVSVICSDKTGTFTRNEMMVETVVVPSGTWIITGQGYAPTGSIARNGSTPSAGVASDVHRLAVAAAHCNDARIFEGRDGWQADGDPMEAALLAFAAKAGVDNHAFDRRRAAEISFDTTRRFMATAASNRDGSTTIYAKGAPETIIAMCAKADAAVWEAAVENLSNRGLRVLAVAEQHMTDAAITLSVERIDGHLTLLGLIGLIDPPRPEAITAVAACRSAGIAVKMITGDHMGTARAIAARLGLAHPDSALSGQAIARMSDDELAAAALRTDVFARTSPEDKLRLVRALQHHGVVVAMTGDGINDSPALKQADVGVAMGQRGSAAAREASRIVLVDDNFATIAAAVEEGRRVYDNLRKAIAYILPTNGGEAFTVVLAIGFGIVSPISPLHILWINMITEVTLSLALAFEAPEPDLMQRPPRSPHAPILTRMVLWRIAFVTTLMVAGTFAVFTALLMAGETLEYARTAAVNVIVAAEAAYLLSARRLHGPGWSGLFRREARIMWTAIAAVAIAEIAFTYLPQMNALFATQPLRPETWLPVLGVAALVFLASETEKVLGRNRRQAGM